MIKRLDTVVAYCQEHRDLLLLLLIGGLYSFVDYTSYARCGRFTFY